MTSDVDTGSAAAASPLPVLDDIMQNALDEFDLDVRWGELDQADSWFGYLPTANEQPGQETCNTENATCLNTCANTHCFTCRGGCAPA